MQNGFESYQLGKWVFDEENSKKLTKSGEKKRKKVIKMNKDGKK